MSEYILEARGVSKSFPGVKALDDIQLSVRKGKVHVIMGENGAGKSTLMKILIGIYEPDSGEVLFDGEKVKFSSTQEALNKGISMIHQELNPVMERTVAENMWLGREDLKGIFKLIDHKALIEKTKEIFNLLEIKIDPETKMKDLTVANIQMVEIAKAISYDSKLIIMDEPSSAITDREVNHLFRMIRKLVEQGVGIIYITHKMNEVFEIADDISVFRDGKFIGILEAKNTNHNEIVKMMVGRELSNIFEKLPAEIGDIRLEVKNLSNSGIFSDVNFSVRRGEILGIAGLVGAGRSEVVETLFGIREKTTGEVFIDGKKVDIKSPKCAVEHRIAFLTEDRKETGIFPMLSLTDNTSMAYLNNYLKSGNILDIKKMASESEILCEKMSVKTPSMNQKIENLSGGNQQKVLLARWLLTNPDILILDEPTRGIDIGAKAEIHKLISQLAQMGKSIIMISSELPEILGMSDRILVMHSGKQKGILNRIDATQERIMELASV